MIVYDSNGQPLECYNPPKRIPRGCIICPACDGTGIKRCGTYKYQCHCSTPPADVAAFNASRKFLRENT